MKRPPGREMLARARRLRRDMTDAERVLWRHLPASQLGVKFRKQMWLGGFIADFASVEAKLVVEVDGGQHGRDRHRDERRARAMAALGYRTLRFWNNDVLENADGVLAMISNAIPSPSHAAAPRGPLQCRADRAPRDLKTAGGSLHPTLPEAGEGSSSTAAIEPPPFRGEGGAHRVSDGRVRE